MKSLQSLLSKLSLVPKAKQSFLSLPSSFILHLLSFGGQKTPSILHSAFNCLTALFVTSMVSKHSLEGLQSKWSSSHNSTYCCYYCYYCCEEYKVIKIKANKISIWLKKYSFSKSLIKNSAFQTRVATQTGIFNLET